MPSPSKAAYIPLSVPPFGLVHNEDEDEDDSTPFFPFSRQDDKEIAPVQGQSTDRRLIATADDSPYAEPPVGMEAWKPAAPVNPLFEKLLPVDEVRASLSDF